MYDKPLTALMHAQVSHGAVNGSLEHQVWGSEAGSLTWMQASGPGVHTIRVGNQRTLHGFDSAVRVRGERHPNQPAPWVHHA